MFGNTAQLLDGLSHEDPTAAAYKALAGVVRQFEEARWSGPDDLQVLVLGSPQREHRGNSAGSNCGSRDRPSRSY